MWRVRDITYPPIVVAVKMAFKAMGLRFCIRGSEHVPRRGGAVLAVNHISYVDFVFGGLAAQQADRLVRYMSKRELFDHRLTGPLVRSLHHIEVDRADGAASYRTAIEFLQAGEVVGVFPEATISRSFELKRFKTGAARLAAAADVPLVPLILWGTQRIYTKDHPRDFSRGMPISLTLGPPVDVNGHDPTADTALLRHEMSRLLDETIRAYPETEPGAWWMPRSYGGSAPTPEEALRLDAEEMRRRAEKRATSKKRAAK